MVSRVSGPELNLRRDGGGRKGSRSGGYYKNNGLGLSIAAATYVGSYLILLIEEPHAISVTSINDDPRRAMVFPTITTFCGTL
jgi:hypothetical protein